MKFTYILTSTLFFLFLFSPLHAAHCPYKNVFKLYWNDGYDYKDYLVYPPAPYTPKMTLSFLKHNGNFDSIIEYTPDLMPDENLYKQDQPTLILTLGAPLQNILEPTVAYKDADLKSVRNIFQLGKNYLIGETFINSYAYSIFLNTNASTSAFYTVLTINQSACKEIQKDYPPRTLTNPDDLKKADITNSDTTTEESTEPTEETVPIGPTKSTKKPTLAADNAATILNDKEYNMGCLLSPNEAVHCPSEN